jgi:hypothetical protein
MQKYVLVSFLAPIEDGTEFMVGHWPLHTTLVSNFAVDLASHDIETKLAELFRRVPAFETVALQDDNFGPQGQVPVTLLDLTPEFAALHSAAVRLLQGQGAVFDEPQYLEAGFKPHVTVQTDGRVQQGDVIRIASVTLVDMFPGDDIQQRKVMRTFELKV